MLSPRCAGERKRIAHVVSRMRSTLEALEISMTQEGPLGDDTAQALLSTTHEIVRAIIQHDAYDRVEKGER